MGKKIKPFIENRRSTTDISICNICSCDFSLQDEGGIDGYIGILYFCFCPTCFSGIVDMCDQLKGYDYDNI
jgi:hypothetical protein